MKSKGDVSKISFKDFMNQFLSAFANGYKKLGFMRFNSHE